MSFALRRLCIPNREVGQLYRGEVVTRFDQVADRAHGADLPRERRFAAGASLSLAKTSLWPQNDKQPQPSVKIFTFEFFIELPR